MFVSLSVWAHHMFTVGMTSVSNAFFTLSTMLVGVPTGIKIFNWIATFWGVASGSLRRCCSASDSSWIARCFVPVRS
jgi:heme/copper-type cytochrome/quinol oxidase subunit 1